MTTDIYGTLGPACADVETLEKMFAAGMSGIRLNLSHVTLRRIVSYSFKTIIGFWIILDLVENMDSHSLDAHCDQFFQCLMFLLGSAELISIHKADRVEYKVKVRMVCILMDRIDALISLTNFVCDHRSDHIGLVRSDKLAAMEGHHKVPDSDLIILLEGCRYLLHLLCRIGDIHAAGSYIAAGGLNLLCDISDHIFS